MQSFDDIIIIDDMYILKKSWLLLFSLLYLGIFSLQWFASYSHHSFVNNENISNCDSSDSCCGSEKECLQKCLPTYEISSNYYKTITKYYESFVRWWTVSRSSKHYYVYKTFIEKKSPTNHKEFFLLSYIGKQKITW